MYVEARGRRGNSISGSLARSEALIIVEPPGPHRKLKDLMRGEPHIKIREKNWQYPQRPIRRLDLDLFLSLRGTVVSGEYY